VINYSDRLNLDMLASLKLLKNLLMVVSIIRAVNLSQNAVLK